MVQLSNGKNDVIKLTGTLAANRTVSIPDSIEKTYFVQNACDHAGNTLTFKTSSGTGVLLCEGNCYVHYILMELILKKYLSKENGEQYQQLKQFKLELNF